MWNQRQRTLDSDLDGLDIDTEDLHPSVPVKKVPAGDIFEASRAGDVDRLRYLIESGTNVNLRDRWDSVALYYACLAGHLDAAKMLLENGAICDEHTFEGDRCYYAALNLRVRKLLKAFEARPPPLGPLHGALRDTFLGCAANRSYLELSSGRVQISGYPLSNNGPVSDNFPPDIVFYVQGRPIEAHRVILSARSPFFKRRFEEKWKDRKEVRFAREKLSYPALFSLILFFYSDRLEVAVDDMEDLLEICKVCKCGELQKVLAKELIHKKYADYKSLGDADRSQKWFILQGQSLPEKDRLPAAMQCTLQSSLVKCLGIVDEMQMRKPGNDLADVCIRVNQKILRCHQVILASRSEYFKARLFRMTDFIEGRDRLPGQCLPILEEHYVNTEAFEKLIEYMYTDGLKDIDPNQAEEIFDAASRYLLFPLKRAVADALLPHLEMVSPAELCHWLMLSDMYGVLKVREYCLGAIACNFETIADTREFQEMLSTLPSPSGESSLRTTLPSAPGAGANTYQGNLLDDLREKWLEAEAAELDRRDESAALFDKRLEMLMLVAEQQNTHTDCQN